MINRKYVTVCALVAVFCTSVSFAEESLAEMYQRKGVKEFVARQYDLAINDLEQARAADPANAKTLKLRFRGVLELVLVVGELLLVQQVLVIARAEVEPLLA